MKKIFLSMTAMLLMTSASISAQSLGDVLKSAASSAAKSAATTAAQKSGNSTLSNIVSGVTNLLGTSSVSESDLAGTWSYSQPAVAFESKNVLTNLGGSAVSAPIEKKMATYLTKAGFTAGKVKLTLNSDGSGTAYYGAKYVPVQWSVSGSDLTLKLGKSSTSTLASATKLSSTLSKYNQVKLNVKKSGSTLQLAAKSSQLAKLLTSISSAVGKSSSTLSTVSSLASNVNGVYLGLKFTK